MLDDVSHYNAPPKIKSPGASPSHVSRDSDRLNPIDEILLGVLVREWLAAAGDVFKSGDIPKPLKSLADAAKTGLKQEIADAALELLAEANVFFRKSGDETEIPSAKGRFLERVGTTTIKEFELEAEAYLSAQRLSANHPLLKSHYMNALQPASALAPAA